MRLSATVAALLFPLWLALPARGQEPTPDTTSAGRYFPLEVGNLWEYEGLGVVTYSSDYRIAVESDTLIEGRRYFVVTHDALHCSPCLSHFTVRFDAETGTVVERTLEGEEVAWWYARCALGADFGSETECGTVGGGYEESFELADGSVLEGVTFKAFDSGVVKEYVADVGFVREAIKQYEPGEARLRYARVGGVEYGTPFAVGVEERPDPLTALSLAAHPNPFNARTMIELVAGRAGRVRLEAYDALGRRIVVLHEGLLPAGSSRYLFDASALPAGAYLVRATGMGVPATTSVTIIR